MKRFFFLFALSILSLYSYSQWNATGSNSSTGDLKIGSFTSGGSLANTLEIRSRLTTEAFQGITFNFNEQLKAYIISQITPQNSRIDLKFRTMNGGGVTSQMLFTGDGNLGIGTNNPRGKLDVNGETLTETLKIGKSANLGTRNSSGYGTINRITIVPYKHTGQWDFFVRDIEHYAYFDIKYSGRELLSIKHNTGIGILNTDPKYPLDVNGDIRGKNIHVGGTLKAKEVKIEINAGADFVFEPNYNLPSLSEVESFIKDNKHLPDIPSEKQMQKDGLSVSDIQIKLLQKIEELTLYIIEQDKKIEKLEEKLKEK